MAPRWRPTLQPAGFGPEVAGKGPAHGGHLASGLPVYRVRSAALMLSLNG
jgi:hypothetical protein